MSYDEFIDMCILCGCDYSDTIEGIGPITSYKLMSEHKSIEKVIEFLKSENDKGKRKNPYVIPENFYYEDSRELFKEATVVDANEIELKWNFNPDEKALKEFLCEGKGFAE